ncbi:MCE family protein [Mycobacterium sp. 236(2023)]|uniref:MCE family protein n=1 Tax=Mycobacterium sp. 236(2023) TaxID=3038163 RepID=UPI002414FBD0|nr:MCE family protein [Mycobacterium sp. 236(2023)]MDG4668062.1 MCE family protein [Mycobacterium sp. 236(2023)]
MTSPRTRAAAALLVAAMLTGTSGCAWQGLNSLRLPGTAGRGDGAFVIQAQMPNVTNLQPNSPVQLNDVTVGSVSKIERQNWHALVTIRLDHDVDLPENSSVTLGQTSLLATLHLELSPPPPGTQAEGKLHEGALIPLASAGSYPDTEQTLSMLSLLLNGGGIGQIQDITTAFSTALAGRETDLRSLLVQLDRFAANLNAQKDDIIAATESLNGLVEKLAAQKPVLDEALRTIPRALAVVSEQRTNLTEAFEQFGALSELARRSADETKEALVAELRNIGPVLESLANAGPAMTRSLSVLATFPWANETLGNWVRGDYANLTAIFDLTLSRLDTGLLTGTRFEGELTELEMQWGRTIGQTPSPVTARNPLVAPYRLDQGP